MRIKDDEMLGGVHTLLEHTRGPGAPHAHHAIVPLPASAHARTLWDASL